MHPDSSYPHLKRAQTLGRSPQPEMEQRDLFGGIVGGIIHGIGQIINGGHHNNNNNNNNNGGGGGGGKTHHSSPPKHNNGGGSKAPAKPAHKPAKSAPAKPKPAAPAKTQKVVDNNQAAAANVHTQATHSSARQQNQNKPTSTTGRSGSSTSLSATASQDLGTTTIDPSSTGMPGTWAPGGIPSGNGVSSTSSTSGLSKGGLAAILLVLLLLLLGVLVFFGRRYKRKQRENRTATSAWAASNYPKFEEKNKTPDAASIVQEPAMAQRKSRVMGDDQSYVTAADLGHHNYSTPSLPVGLIAHTGHSPALSPITPSFAAENRQRSAFSEFGRSPPTSPRAFPAHESSTPLTPLTGMPFDMAGFPQTPRTPGSFRSESFGAQTASGSGHSSNLTAMEALVSQVFVPTLDDELKVSTGERIRVLSEYDDGWALCQNASGEEGMVPIECIQKLSSGPAGLQPNQRNSQRMSSLNGH